MKINKKIIVNRAAIKKLRFDSILLRKVSGYQTQALNPLTKSLNNISVTSSNSADHLALHSKVLSTQYISHVTNYLGDPNLAALSKTALRTFIENLVSVTQPTNRSELALKPEYKWISLWRRKRSLLVRQRINNYLLWDCITPCSERVDSPTLSEPPLFSELFYLFEHAVQRDTSLDDYHVLSGLMSLEFSDWSSLARTNTRDLKRILRGVKGKIQLAVLDFLFSQIDVKSTVKSGYKLNKLVESLTQMRRLQLQMKSVEKALAQSQSDKTNSLGTPLTNLEFSKTLGALNMLGKQVLSNGMSALTPDLLGNLALQKQTAQFLHHKTTEQRAKNFQRLSVLSEVIEYRAVSRTRAGGRTRRFRVLLVIGRKTGWLGVGIGKHKYIPEAMEQAKREACRNIIRLRRTSTGSIPHFVTGKFKKAQVLIRPLSVGSGMMTGQTLQNMLVMAGYSNLWALQLGSANRICNVRATLNALKQLRFALEVGGVRRPPFSNKYPYSALFSALKAAGQGDV